MTGTDKTGKAGSGGELHMQATTWPTPSAHGSAGEDSPDLERKGSKLVNRKTGRILQTNLATEVKHWPTATAKDADSAGNRSSPLCNPGTSLHEAATNWPTPRTLTGGGESAERKKELGREEAGGGDLQAAAETWPTPNQRDYKGSDLTTRRGGASLSHYAEKGERIHSSRQVPVISTHGAELSKTEVQTSERRRLNPAFVCWLMGWPWWWTRAEGISFAQRETESYLSRLRSRLSSLLEKLD